MGEPCPSWTGRKSSCDAYRHTRASVRAIESFFTMWHLISFISYIHCTLRFLWHFHVCFLFCLLCSVPRFSWEQIPLLPLLILFSISFLYHLLLIFSLQYLRQLLCRSPAVQIALHRGRSSCQWLTKGARSRLGDF